MDTFEQIPNPVHSHRHSVGLTHVLNTLEEARFLDAAMLRQKHGILNGEQFIQHALSKERQHYCSERKAKALRKTYVDQ